MLIFLVHLYKNDSNILWKHLVKFELNSMNTEYPKTLLSNVTNVFTTQMTPIRLYNCLKMTYLWKKLTYSSKE
jgi:hypothetical protein